MQIEDINDYETFKDALQTRFPEHCKQTDRYYESLEQVADSMEGEEPALRRAVLLYHYAFMLGALGELGLPAAAIGGLAADAAGFFTQTEVVPSTTH
jgi:hypothetical protein